MMWDMRSSNGFSFGAVTFSCSVVGRCWRTCLKCESTVGEIRYAFEWTSEEAIHYPLYTLGEADTTKCESMAGKASYGGEQARPIQNVNQW